MSSSTPALRLKIKVMSVSDGDTIKAITKKGEKPFKVRLYGIDAPELDQEYGPESRDALAKMVEGKIIFVEIVDVDTYGRQVGILHGGNHRKSVNKALVELGLAYNWPKYGMLWGGHNAQKRARSKRTGLWKRFGGEVRPWSHRHGGKQTPIEFAKAKLEQAEREKAESEARVKKALALLDA